MGDAIVMSLRINESIDVLALFEGRKMRPLKFRWNGSTYKIVEITANWQTRNGASRMRHYTARDAASNYYQISFDPATATWSVNGVWSGR